MSLGRRSERAKKKVNYSLFCTEEGDEEENISTNSDDDFQDSPGPPSKKRKVVKPKLARQTREETGSKKREPPSRKERLSLEDKIYKRELEAALEASRKESSQDDSKSVDEEEIDDEQEENDIHLTLKQDRKKSTSASEDNDKENNSEENKPRKVTAGAEELKSDAGKSINNTTKKNMPVSFKEQSDDDLQVPKEEAQPDDESDLDLEKDDSDNESFGEDGDEESDFEEELAGKKPRKTKSRVQLPAASTRPGIKPRTSVTVTPLKMRKGKKRGKPKSLPAAGSGYSLSPSISSSASNSPSIKNSSSAKNSLSVSSKPSPPLKSSSASTPRLSLGTGLGGVNLNRSRPAIRLGLSRNVRVKPLHPNMPVQQH